MTTCVRLSRVLSSPRLLESSHLSFIPSVPLAQVSRGSDPRRRRPIPAFSLSAGQPVDWQFLPEAVLRVFGRLTNSFGSLCGQLSKRDALRMFRPVGQESRDPDPTLADGCFSRYAGSLSSRAQLSSKNACVQCYPSCDSQLLAPSRSLQ